LIEPHAVFLLGSSALLIKSGMKWNFEHL